LALLLIALPPVIWLLWAENEYSGIDYCPWDTHRGHPVLIALILLIPSVAVMAWRERHGDHRLGLAAAIGTGLLAGLTILVAAVFFGAGLRCQDDSTACPHSIIAIASRVCVDKSLVARENQLVLAYGAARRQIAHTLNAAYANGLLSEDTFVRRLEQALRAGVIDPGGLVGDLNLRTAHRGMRERVADTLRGSFAGLQSLVGVGAADKWVLLGLDWSGGQRDLLIGRHLGCDMVLSDPSVSRRHARLVFRDGSWVVQDLQSTNGTVLNGTRVGRCELRPGDQLILGNERLQID
jgi:hypothetical protein